MIVEVVAPKPNVVEVIEPDPNVVEVSFVRGLRGPAGHDGKDGKDGKDGADGAVGPTGATGATGATGPQGEQGPSGVIAVDGTYITNSGTSSSANLSFVPSALTLAQSQVTGLVTALAGKAALTASQTFTGTQTIVTAAAADKGLVIRGSLGQSVNLQEWQNSNGAFTARIAPDGAFSVGQGESFFGGSTKRLFALAANATTVPITAKGAASQSANLTEWQNSAGSVLAKIDSNGNFTTNTVFPQTINITDNLVMGFVNQGGTLRMSRGTAASAPPANQVRIQVLAGTTGSKLVAVGPSGTAYTILDNIT